jgi:hypothetical protein
MMIGERYSRIPYDNFRYHLWYTLALRTTVRRRLRAIPPLLVRVELRRSGRADP